LRILFYCSSVLGFGLTIFANLFHLAEGALIIDRVLKFEKGVIDQAEFERRQRGEKKKKVKKLKQSKKLK